MRSARSRYRTCALASPGSLLLALALAHMALLCLLKLDPARHVGHQGGEEELDEDENVLENKDGPDER